jgi:3-(methylthio)propionyl---CoA ligase
MGKQGKLKPTGKGLRKTVLRKTKTGDLPRSRPRSRNNRKPDRGRNIFRDLQPNAANFAPLTPVSFLPRSAEIHPGRFAVIHGPRRYSYRQFYDRARQLASALATAGVRAGDTVSVMLPNVPAMLEAHYGVPMLGAVLNTINTRL